MSNTLPTLPRFFLVGERGPEMFVPRNSASVVSRPRIHDLHSGAWFTAEGERAARRATRQAAAVIVVVALLIILAVLA